MAIRRLDPKATFKVVSQYDDAVIAETAEELELLKASKEKTRYEKYLESFNLADLKFKEDAKPTHFVVRCLQSLELAELNEKHIEANVVEKTMQFKERNKMLFEMFELGCLGIESENGKVEKIGTEELDAGVVIEVGSIISLMTTLGKNLKKA